MLEVFMWHHQQLLDGKFHVLSEDVMQLLLLFVPVVRLTFDQFPIVVSIASWRENKVNAIRWLSSELKTRMLPSRLEEVSHEKTATVNLISVHHLQTMAVENAEVAALTTLEEATKGGNRKVVPRVVQEDIAPQTQQDFNRDSRSNQETTKNDDSQPTIGLTLSYHP